MRLLKTIILLLLLPSLVWADGVLTPAANPPQPITILSTSGIPFIKAPSGTMGNNGAVSAMTALPSTYSGGAYLWLPAGAVAAGVPAAATWYYFVGSSTTAGTVYNNTYTSGTPTRPAAPTAFSTTGPGAFTGSTSAVTAVSLSVPANLLGRDGVMHVEYVMQENTTGGNKTFATNFGGTDCLSFVNTSQASATGLCNVRNRGLTNLQVLDGYAVKSTGSAAGGATETAIDTTAATTLLFTLTTAVATDYLILTHYWITMASRN